MLPRQSQPGGAWQPGNLDPTASSNTSGSPNYPSSIIISEYGTAGANDFEWDLPGPEQEADVNKGHTLGCDQARVQSSSSTLEAQDGGERAWNQQAAVEQDLDRPYLAADRIVSEVNTRHGARENFSNPVPLQVPAAPAKLTGSLNPSAATAHRNASQRVQSSEMPSSAQTRTGTEDGRPRQRSTSKRPSRSRTSTGDDVIKVDSNADNSQPTHALSDENGQKTSILRTRQIDAINDIKGSLPAERGFPIQIGSELFRLSGASIMSDAPSYFSKFFEEQLRQSEEPSAGFKTLYIDRDPSTFQDIALHLQGYRITIRDGSHYVKLFADAQFYSLPKLIRQLFESEICIRIGEQDFRVSRDIFSSPGNSPNFFSLGFAIFAPNPGEIFPGLDRQGLFRPPSIEPPSILNRSAVTFTDILHLLRGYPLEIRSLEHRSELLRDCRYYHFRGLEQQLLQHSITFNVARQNFEIVLRLEDIRQSGVSFSPTPTPSDSSPLAGWVNYARPFVDETSYELILELGDENTRLSLRTMRAEFFGQAKARITSLFQVVANKMNLPTNVPLGLMMSSGGAAAQPVSPGNTPLSDDLVKVAVERDAHVVLDGEEYNTADLLTPMPYAGPVADDASDVTMSSTTTAHSGDVQQGASGYLLAPSRSPSVLPPPRKRKRRGSLDEFGEWVIKRGQWRLRVQPRPEQDGEGQGRGMEIVMMAVKLDAVSGQRGRNAARGFLN